MRSADRYARSFAQHTRAAESLAGGVATAFRALQVPVPICFERGTGSRLLDIDGNEYIDYALGFGPMFLGHDPQGVIESVRRQLDRGLGYGACHDLEAELAETVCRVVPSAELCIFSNTGSEAVHVALRIARAFTGRTRIVKFRGHYHGWMDAIHVGVPGHLDEAGTAGQDGAVASSITLCDWDNLGALEAVAGDDLAAIIMEPVAVNGGCFQPSPGYLEGVRELANECGSLLIFDEVITGFRVALGGAQQLLGVLPDLTILGKALGAGFPISAVCGRRDVLELVAARRVAHVGTFNANPVCAAAAVAALAELERDAESIYPRVTTRMDELVRVLTVEAGGVGLPLVINHAGAAGHAFCSQAPVEDVAHGERTDGDLYRRFAAALLDEGVHVIPRGLLYVSTVHTKEDLELTREATRRAVVSVIERHRDRELAKPTVL
jgi:glutamate-1-semialdehyde 2,1-aminomutase